MFIIPIPWPAGISKWDTRRFLSKVQIDSNGCWIWQGALKQGKRKYGFFGWNNKSWLAHRVSYEWWVGYLDDELEIHHKCNIPSCVNPAHLDQITRYENLMCSNGITAQNARKVVCPKGHPYSGENLRINAQGRRVCRVCERANLIRSRTKKRFPNVKWD